MEIDFPKRVVTLPIVYVLFVYNRETMSYDGIVAGRQPAVQYILYESDSVEITYADGTCIQLSPCATTFVCQQPLSPDSHHPINGILLVLFVLLAL